MAYEVGDRLYWFDSISVSGENEPGPNAPERYATVVHVEDDDTVHVHYDDGLDDYIPAKNVPDYFERVTWDVADEKHYEV